MKKIVAMTQETLKAGIQAALSGKTGKGVKAPELAEDIVALTQAYVLSQPPVTVEAPSTPHAELPKEEQFQQFCVEKFGADVVQLKQASPYLRDKTWEFTHGHLSHILPKNWADQSCEGRVFTPVEPNPLFLQLSGTSAAYVVPSSESSSTIVIQPLDGGDSQRIPAGVITALKVLPDQIVYATPEAIHFQSRLETESPLAEIPIKGVTHLAVSETHVVAVTSDQVIIYDRASKKEVQKIPAEVSAIDLSESLLVLGCPNGHILVSSDFSRVIRFQAHEQPVSHVKVQGDTVFSTAGKQVRRWDHASSYSYSDTPRPSAEASHKNGDISVLDVVALPTGEVFVLTYGTHAMVRTPDLAKRYEFDHEKSTAQLCVSPNFAIVDGYWLDFSGEHKGDCRVSQLGNVLSKTTVHLSSVASVAANYLNTTIFGAPKK